MIELSVSQINEESWIIRHLGVLLKRSKISKYLQSR